MTTIIYIMLTLGLAIAGLNIIPSISTYPLPYEMTSAIQYFIQILKNWNWLFAIDTLFQAVILILGYELLIWSWFHILVPTIKFIRGHTQ